MIRPVEKVKDDDEKVIHLDCESIQYYWYDDYNQEIKGRSPNKK